MVRKVYAGAPAYEQGLNTGDQMVALNNMRANKEFFDARIAEKRAGDLVALNRLSFRRSQHIAHQARWASAFSLSNSAGG